MHIEFLIEDTSTRRLLEYLVPRMIGDQGMPHTWRMHAYQGLGRLPRDLSGSADPSHRLLLDKLPQLLRAYRRTQGVDAVVVVLDVDRRDCRVFLQELRSVADACGSGPEVLFRLAIEETEAWYLGDRAAMRAAFPRGRFNILDRYAPDTICGTWELLAEAIHPGGMNALRQAKGILPGQLKHEWAERIGPFLDPNRNLSPSFGKLRDGLRRLVGLLPPSHTAPPLPC
jgi:hypothetical protein